MAAVKVDQGAEIDVAEVVGIDHHDLLRPRREVPIGMDRARRAQKLRLMAFAELQAARRILPRDVGTHRLGQVVGVEQRLADARRFQRVAPVVEHRPTAHLDQAFGHGVGERAQPRAQTARQQKRARHHQELTARTTPSAAISLSDCSRMSSAGAAVSIQSR